MHLNKTKCWYRFQLKIFEILQGTNENAYIYFTDENINRNQYNLVSCLDFHQITFPDNIFNVKIVKYSIDFILKQSGTRSEVVTSMTV